MTKMTKKEKFEMLMAMEEVQENEILKEFIEKEIEALEKKKNSTSKAVSKKREENEKLASILYDGMEEDKQYSISDIIQTMEEFKELSTSKVSAILKIMIEKEKPMVARIVIKRKPYFEKI